MLAIVLSKHCAVVDRHVEHWLSMVGQKVGQVRTSGDISWRLNQVDANYLIDFQNISANMAVQSG